MPNFSPSLLALARSLLAAGLVTLPAAAPASSDRAADVLAWSEIAARTSAAAAFNPPVETRSLALVHAAMFDAAASVEGGYRPYLSRLPAPAGASASAAAAAAAHRVLSALYLAQQAALDLAYRERPGHASGPRALEEGAALGREVADRLLAARAGDGAAEAVTAPYQPGSGAGAWVPTPPAHLPALDPGWGTIRPFTLRRPSQFRPGPPPDPAGAIQARDLAEVRTMGAAQSTARSARQTDLARAWVATAPQNWNPLARQALERRDLSAAACARVLALLHLAGADAFIASWDAKFTWSQWRPVTAIRAASDATWTPLLVTPPFPDYVAGHSAYAGAAARVLEELLGEPGVPLLLQSRTAPGATLRYASFAAVADDVVEARVLGGVHWRTSSVVGRELGERIGRWAVQRLLRREGEREEEGEE